MKQNPFFAGLPLAALLLTGCIDNKYDLDDLDTTTEIKVNNLVLPVNFDVVTLSDIITIDEDSKIKEIEIDGKKVYAVTETGDFHSDPIDVPGFTAPAPSVPKGEATFALPDVNGVASRRAPRDATRYNILSFTPQNVNFKAEGIDGSILDIEAIGCEPLQISLAFRADGVADILDLSLENLRFSFLKGLTIRNLPSGCSYDAASGILEVSEIDCGSDGVGTIAFMVDAIDLHAGGASYDYAAHRLDYNSEINITEGYLAASLKSSQAAIELPGNIGLSVETSVEALKATTFTGSLNYRLDGNGLNISPVDLSDLPDFLAQEETNLRLANPQIYLQVNNPLGEDHLKCQTGMTLTAVRGDDRKSYSLDNNGVVEIGYDKAAGPYNFVLSPSIPSSPSADFAQGLEHVAFTGLSDVLSGNGLPKSIDIDLDDPQVPAQRVVDFRLDSSLPGIEGKYEFLAPLALKGGDNGSVIVYRDRKDGWGDEDVEKITIEVLEIEADVTSTIPLKAVLTATPIDVDGNLMNVNVEGGVIEANAQNQHIVLRTTGVVKRLDGISFEAVVRPANGDQAIGPDQTIELRNVKARVTGNYTTDF